MAKLVPSNVARTFVNDRIAIVFAISLPACVVVLLTASRGSVPNAISALLLAALIVAIAARGRAAAGMAAAISTVVWFDILLVQPFDRMKFPGRENTETMVLLLLVGVLASGLAVRDRRERNEADAWFEISFEQAGIGAGIVNLQGIPVRVNKAVCELLGRPEELLLGRNWDDYHHPDELPIGQAMRARGVSPYATYTDERRFVRPDGSVVWAAFFGVLVRDRSGNPLYYLTQLQDITERKTIEAQAAHQALHDALTGLPNRALLADRLNQGLIRTRQVATQLGVLFLDVDHFKIINDSLGYSVGDDFLGTIVDRLSAVIGPNDTVARFGGDEFVVVCDNVTFEQVKAVGQRILGAIRAPYRLGDEDRTVTVSLGIVLADDAATPESLLRDSVSAMYLAKERGRDRVEFFDETLRVAAETRVATIAALGSALERDELVVHYQPVFDLRTGALVSAEALLRWERPEWGLVPPAQFISLAEDAGLIIPIGKWVLEQACRELIEWQIVNPAMSVAVNLSVRQLLVPDIAAQVGDVLRRTGVRPESVCLELTESIFMGEVEYFGPMLAGLKALGVALAIDDFGTGYSSLSYLKRFPVDAVKIDRSFIDGLGEDPHDSALVTAIVAIAEALDLDIIAEGIETGEQLAILKRLNCPRGQGFYLAMPLTKSAISALVSSSACPVTVAAESAVTSWPSNCGIERYGSRCETDITIAASELTTADLADYYPLEAEIDTVQTLRSVEGLEHQRG